MFVSKVKEQKLCGMLHEIHVSAPTVYVDNEARERSGCLSHAMAQLGSGSIVCFNSNCSPVRYDGHSNFGWVEYRYSGDGGKTFGEVQEFPYARKAYLDGTMTVSAQKAVCCSDGTLIVFCTRNLGYFTWSYGEPYDVPVFLMSEDGGRTFSGPYNCYHSKGCVYDALYHEGTLYWLQFCNMNFRGSIPEHQYRLYKSENNGRDIYERSVVGFADTKGLAYGCLTFLPDGGLAAYAQDMNDMKFLHYAVSYDLGKTWAKTGKTRVEKGAENPQIKVLDGQYILHARGGAYGKQFVIYTSADGLNWDEGHILNPEGVGGSFESNSIIVKDPLQEGREYMLVQFTESYEPSPDAALRDRARVNVMHLIIESCERTGGDSDESGI